MATATRESDINIYVNKQYCKGCEICVLKCPTDVFEMAGEPPETYPDPVDSEDCIDCGICELICPDFALEVEASDV